MKSHLMGATLEAILYVEDKTVLALCVDGSFTK